MSYLEDARSRGDLLVVGVNSDESVTRLKGKQRPFIPLTQRMQMLAGLACVDHVVPFLSDQDTPQELISTLVPDVLVRVVCYSKDAKAGARNYIVGEDVVRSAGGIVETITFVAGLSTSKLVEKIRGG